MKSHRGFLTALVLGMTALACAIPGLPSASSSPPTPDTRLERMVAETVSAALETTQQAEPTPTEEIPPTPTPTLTLAPTATPSAESVLDKNADGSYTFVDLLARYQLTIPMQWLAMRANAQEIEAISQLPETANPAIQRSLATIKSLDPNVVRLFMLDVTEEHIDGGFVTNINVLWNQQMETSALSQEEMKAYADELASSLGNAEVLATEIHVTGNEVPYGLILTRSAVTTPEGADLFVIQKLIFFDTPVGTLNITLSTTETWRETVEPSFDEIIESFILLE